MSILFGGRENRHREVFEDSVLTKGFFFVNFEEVFSGFGGFWMGRKRHGVPIAAVGSLGVTGSAVELTGEGLVGERALGDATEFRAGGRDLGECSGSRLDDHRSENGMEFPLRVRSKLFY